MSSGGLLTGTGPGGIIQHSGAPNYTGIGIIAYDSTGASTTAYFNLTINPPGAPPSASQFRHSKI
jgi:hypothetical protein